MRVVVDGRSGFIANAVVAELARTGHRVLGLARSPASPGRLAAGVPGMRSSRADVGMLGAAVAGPAGPRERR